MLSVERVVVLWFSTPACKIIVLIHQFQRAMLVCFPYCGTINDYLVLLILQKTDTILKSTCCPLPWMSIPQKKHYSNNKGNKESKCWNKILYIYAHALIPYIFQPPYTDIQLANVFKWNGEMQWITRVSCFSLILSGFLSGQISQCQTSSQQDESSRTATLHHVCFCVSVLLFWRRDHERVTE